MKKIVTIIILLVICSLTGCIQKHPVITIPEEVNTINKAIADFEYNSATIDDIEELETIIDMYDSLNDNFKEYIVNYQVILDNYELAIKLREENTLIEQSIDNLKKTLAELIPSSTYSNLDLPQTATINGEEINLMWTSSDVNTIFNGLVINGRTNKLVKIKCSFTYRNKVESIEKNINVEPITFNKLDGNNVFTYMYSSSFGDKYTESDLKTIDVVNLCFADIYDGEVDILSMGNIRNILSLRRDSKIRVCICITGYGSETKAFSDAASTEEGRNKLAVSIADAIEKYHFDGIDIDWEYPGSYRSVSVDRQNYTLFMQTLYKEVKSRNNDYIVSGALPASLSNNGLISRYEVSKIANYMDYIHLMTYDMNSSSVTSHHTSLNGTISSIQTYINNGAKPEQLTAGIAFYGKQFRINGDGVLGVRCSNRQTISFDYIMGYINANLPSRFITYWDNNNSAPYMEVRHYDSNNNLTYRDFITYDDMNSVSLKVNYAKSNGLAGVMCWEYGENKGQELQKVIYEVLKQNK